MRRRKVSFSGPFRRRMEIGHGSSVLVLATCDRDSCQRENQLRQRPCAVTALIGAKLPDTPLFIFHLIVILRRIQMLKNTFLTFYVFRNYWGINLNSSASSSVVRGERKHDRTRILHFLPDLSAGLARERGRHFSRKKNTFLSFSAEKNK